MEWYYSSNNKMSGPVSQDEFNCLILSGHITEDSQVWRAGMADWQTYGSLFADEDAEPVLKEGGEQACPVCGNEISEGHSPATNTVCDNCEFTHRQSAMLDLHAVGESTLWYYSNNHQQAGPVNQNGLNELVSSGVISENTLVWRSGWDKWENYGSPYIGLQNHTPMLYDGQVRCSECNRIFSENDVIQHGDSSICEDCKPIFLQKLKDGSWDQGLGIPHRYGGFFVRAGAKIIDGLVVNFIVFVLAVIAGIIASIAGIIASIAGNAEIDQDPIFMMFMHLFSLIIKVGYSVYFLGTFSATPGKMALGLKVVMPDGSPISYTRAFGRFFAEILSALILGIGYLMAAFDSEKRTLHDRICNTRVVKK